MASCKHIRWCSSLLNGARGRGISTEVLAALQSLVTDTGKHLLPILTESLRAEKEQLQEKLEYQNEPLLKELEYQNKLLRKELEYQKKLLRKELEYQKKLCASLQQLLRKETELRTKTYVDLLRARGLNDTRGLFEAIQANLAITSQIPLRLKGADAWEAILKVNAGLATCIQNCTKVPSSNVAKQALNCYNVYSILLQHVHAGKSLAELEVGEGGTIMFERGPLSSEQVQIFLCMGAAAAKNIQENTASGTR